MSLHYNQWNTGTFLFVFLVIGINPGCFLIPVKFGYFLSLMIPTRVTGSSKSLGEDLGETFYIYSRTYLGVLPHRRKDSSSTSVSPSIMVLKNRL